MDQTLIFILSLLATLVTQLEGLRCHTCAHEEIGQIHGFNHDESCKWGVKPKAELLQNCLSDGENNEEGNKFDFICTELRVDGYYTGLPETRFVGTLRGCGARLIGTSKQAENGTGLLARKECLQGRLDTVVKHFKEATGKEYLEGMSAIFNDLTTTVKFCVCDENGCWENQQVLPEAGAEGITEAVTEAGATNHPPVTLFIISNLIAIFHLKR